MRLRKSDDTFEAVQGAPFELLAVANQATELESVHRENTKLSEEMTELCKKYEMLYEVRSAKQAIAESII